MIKILANDGIHSDGKLLLEEANYQVVQDKVAQEDLVNQIGEYDVLIVRSATKVTKEVIDAGKKLKVIARGGVGLDNIDVAYAESKGIEVYNTPQASSRAVAEMAFAHMLALARMLHLSNREMYEGGDFKKLKKAYAAGFQLHGKTLGIIGFGRIGQEVAKIALGLGMEVLAHDPLVPEKEIGIQLYRYNDLQLNVRLQTVPFDRVIQESDFITFHLPGGTGQLISSKEIGTMKTGVVLINTARGGVIDENALLEALESGKVGGAGLDVFENEPNPKKALLQHPRVSCSPHIGGSTVEAQSYIGMGWPTRSLPFLAMISRQKNAMQTTTHLYRSPGSTLCPGAWKRRPAFLFCRWRWLAGGVEP